MDNIKILMLKSIKGFGITNFFPYLCTEHNKKWVALFKNIGDGSDSTVSPLGVYY